MQRVTKALIRALCALMFITVALTPYASVRAHTSATSPVEWACWPEDWTPWCRDDDSDAALYQITMVDASDGWAVGGGGNIFRWDGGAWSRYPTSTDQAVFSIAMVTTSDGWAVGAGGLILHWDGSRWSQHESPRRIGICMVSRWHRPT